MQYLQHLDDGHRAGVLALIADATDHDGFPPIAEHVLLHLRHGGDSADSHIIICHGATVVGYAHLDLTDKIEGPSVELVIHPLHRKMGYEQEILTKAIEVSGARIRFWSHGEINSIQELAVDFGFKRIRTVIQMRRSLVGSLPALETNVPVRTFLPGIDNQEWVKLNNEIFISHPDQGHWSERDLEIRLSEGWFDPNGFFLAIENDEMVAFCWTKIHGRRSHAHAGESNQHDHDPIGEIYIMGVKPQSFGKGLGKAMTLHGLRYLRQRGIFSAMLYVDSDNDAALSLYKYLGFTEYGRDILYRMSPIN